MRDTVGNLLVFCLLVLLAGMFVVTITTSYDATNVSVRANITQSRPIILSVFVDDGINGPLNVTLTEGAYRLVTCNVTVRDYNGYGDIRLMNATFFHITSSHGAADDNNTHYTNTNCSTIGNDGQYIGYYACPFSVAYYANNGTWTCNATAEDSKPYQNSLFNTTIIEQLFAINVTDIIDYGNLAVEDTSTDRTANVTNFGNMNLNITVFGYGAVQNDGLSMVCEVGNISVDSQHYSVNGTAVFADKQILESGAQWVNALTVFQQTNDTVLVTNATYWQLYVPPNPFGVCNGTVVFEATATI
jgi:hypothetical protein